MIAKIFAAFCTLIILQSSIAQSIDKEKLDAYFQALESNNKSMGSVAISKDGQIVYTKSIGYADVESKTKPNENTKYRIGSISKTFTTVLVLKAVEEKKVALSQTIDKYFPSIKNANKITLSHLLYHRSGIHNFTATKDYSTWETEKKTQKEMVDIIAKAGSDFTPDSTASYSNSNYVLLSYILTSIYKKPYSEILIEKIVKPLGLKNTYFGGKIDLSKNECNSYKFTTDWNKETETDMSIPMGAGGIVSTPSDLTLFASALFDYKILSKESVAQMTSLKDRYGMGLFQIPFGDKKSYGHTGGIDGFSSVFSIFPEEKIAYAFTCNGSNYENNNISIAVLSILFNKPFTIPDFKTIAVSVEELESYVGMYSSLQMPLKITITRDGNVLMAQATGQSAFPLEATEKGKFKFAAAGIQLEFNPAKKEMILKQGGGVFTFTKE